MSKLLNASHSFFGDFPGDVADWLGILVDVVRLGLAIRSLRKEKRSKDKDPEKETKPEDSPKGPNPEPSTSKEKEGGAPA